MKIAKSLVQRDFLAGEDPWLGISVNCNVPTLDMGTSPAQRFSGRHSHTQLPTNSSLLEPELDREQKRKLEEKQD